MTDDDRITILLVDDHALVRDGLRELLQTQRDMLVVGEAGDHESAVTLVAERKPDIVLLDVEIPGGDVTMTVGKIRSRSPQSRVIILSMHEGARLVQPLLTAGIRGYLLKSIHWQELVVAIRAVHADSDRLVLGVSRDSLAYVPQDVPQGTLSARELEVLDLVAQALSNSQIASRLNLTEATVKRHLRNIFVKLGAVSRLDAVNKVKEWQQRCLPVTCCAVRFVPAGVSGFVPGRISESPFFGTSHAHISGPSHIAQLPACMAPVHGTRLLGPAVSG
jgi:DNA-binding NarL/FixJ family response regulator